MFTTLKNKTEILGIIAVTFACLAFYFESASIAATSAASARLRVVPSIISKTLRSTSKVDDPKVCEYTRLTFYKGKTFDTTVLSSVSKQCTNVYEIPGEKDSLIIIP